MRTLVIFVLLITNSFFITCEPLHSQNKSKKQESVAKKQESVLKKSLIIEKPITATTKSGQIVLLNTDGTWEFTGDSIIVVPPLSETIKSALKELRKFAGATEVGISFKEYSTRVIDLKSSVEEALIELKDGELKTNMKTALDAYVDASTFWNETLKPDEVANMNGGFEKKFADLKYQFGRSPLNRYPTLRPFQEKYRIPIQKDKDGEEQIFRDEGLNVIWTFAKTATEHATQLSK
jgi:hypothetical protein